MYRVVLAVNEDPREAEAQLSAIEALAGEMSALKMTVVYVFRDVEGPAYVSIHQPIGDFREQLDDLREVPPSLDEVTRQLEVLDIEVHVRLERGDPAAKIIEIARDLDADAIHVGGRKRSAIGKAVMGSVAQEVILNADRPVTVALTGQD